MCISFEEYQFLHFIPIVHESVRACGWMCACACVCGGGQRQPVLCNLLKHKTGEILVLEETAPSSTTSLCQVIHIYNFRIWAM